MSRSYAQFAAALGLRVCRGVYPTTGQTCYADHARGAYDDHDRMLHWADRKYITRTGIRRFLLAASASSVSPQEPPWRRLYLQNVWISAAAKRLGVVLPGRLADLDRAKVRALLATVPEDAPLRAEALRWSLR